MQIIFAKSPYENSIPGSFPHVGTDYIIHNYSSIR